MSRIKALRGLLGVSLGLWFLGCGTDPGEVRGRDDLTSAEAVERNLTVKGYVYVDENASDYTIKSAVQRQIRTAFGPLRVAKISVDDREFANNIDPTSFSSEVMEAVKKDEQGAVTVLKKVQRVSYTYKGRALVIKNLANKTSFSFALLMGNYQSFVNDIIKQCVEDYSHDQEFASSFWYVFAPNESTCKTLISAEVDEIQKERQGLTAGQLGEKELARRFLPISAQLDATTAPKTTYPEYDRLYKISDPSADRIKVYQIMGVASHAGDPDNERFQNDMGFKEFMKTLKTLADKWTNFKLASDSPCDPFSFTFEGKTYDITVKQAYSWVVNGSALPSDVPSDKRDKFMRAFHDNLVLKWIKMEVPLEVKASHVTKSMTLELNFLFGTESGYNVRSYFRQAFKNGDVVLYNGHSYIGSGPLDPNNYSSSDFASGYQIFFFNSCVSYNYYGVDYFDLKSGGTQELDLVNNGIEVYISNGGKSMGQFLLALFDAQPNTWLKILEKTQVSAGWYGTHDPNRAVDGEQDNTYDPSTMPIDVKEGAGTLAVDNTSAGCGATVNGTVQLSATATGAARVVFLVDGTEVGSDNSAPFSVSWDTTKATDGSATITARAYDAAGKTAEDGCSVTVQNSSSGGGDLFSDDMESGSGNWTATGFWHLSTSGTCATPAYASASSAWYFGQASTCDYSSSAAVKGTLTSKAISGITATSSLSFKFWREVESSSSGEYDKTVVEVAVDGTSSWKKVWSKSSKDASAKAWKSSGALSLAEYAGKSIQIRFSFDSVDNYENDHVGWMIDDVVVSR